MIANSAGLPVGPNCVAELAAASALKQKATTSMLISWFASETMIHPGKTITFVVAVSGLLTHGYNCDLFYDFIIIVLFAFISLLTHGDTVDLFYDFIISILLDVILLLTHGDIDDLFCDFMIIFYLILFYF